MKTAKETIEVVKPKDLVPDAILGVITPNMDPAKYVEDLERYYGFPCAIFEIEANRYGYLLDELRQPKCPHCGESTNRAYREVPNLKCWNCGHKMALGSINELER